MFCVNVSDFHVCNCHFKMQDKVLRNQTIKCYHITLYTLNSASLQADKCLNLVIINRWLWQSNLMKYEGGGQEVYFAPQWVRLCFSHNVHLCIHFNLWQLLNFQNFLSLVMPELFPPNIIASSSVTSVLLSQFVKFLFFVLQTDFPILWDNSVEW